MFQLPTTYHLNPRWLRGPVQIGRFKLGRFGHPNDDLVDLGICLLVTIIAIRAVTDNAPSMVAMIFVILAALPLVWRRHAPVAAFVAIDLITLVAVVSVPMSQMEDGLVVVYSFAIYAIGAFGRNLRTGVLALLSVLPLLLIAAGKDGPDSGDALFLIWLAFLFTVGRALGYRRDYLHELQERLRLTILVQEEEAQRRVEQERVAIARDLHDIVAHSIATIGIQATVGLHLHDRDPQRSGEASREALEQIRIASASAMAEFRDILMTLRNPMSDSDLLSPPAGLDRLPSLVSTTRASGLDVSLSVTGVVVPISSLVDITAYRIIQESITNVLRHADATQVTIEITWQPEKILIVVRNNGTASSPRDASRGSGFGIRGMQERALMVGGNVEAGPETRGGFTVTAWIPTLHPSEGAQQ